MTAFTLDTSGVVGPVKLPNSPKVAALGWPDLSSFVQGYVEALFNSPDPRNLTATKLQTGEKRAVLLGEWAGFSDLSPEALALILRDCEADIAASHSPDIFRRDVGLGGAFWRARQLDKSNSGAGPLTPTLGDDGRVYLAEVSQ